MRLLQLGLFLGFVLVVFWGRVVELSLSTLQLFFGFILLYVLKSLPGWTLQKYRRFTSCHVVLSSSIWLHDPTSQLIPFFLPSFISSNFPAFGKIYGGVLLFLLDVYLFPCLVLFVSFFLVTVCTKCHHQCQCGSLFKGFWGDIDATNLLLIDQFQELDKRKIA